MGWGTETKTKPRNPRKAKGSAIASGLLEAINFVSMATEAKTTDFREYGRIVNGWLIAFDGSMAAGHPIEEDMLICPHLARLKDAISRAGTTLALNATENGRLSVTGDKLRAVVPCLPGAAIPPVMPDTNIASLDDRLNKGFAAVTSLAKEDADKVHEASVLLRANTIVGCNGQLMFEYWHGIDLPPDLAIPQKCAKMIAKSPKPLTGFGFDPGRSATFYFEGGAWIKTQLYAEQWPDIDKVLNMPAYCADTPPGLFDALDAILSFSEDGAVHFETDKLKSTYGNAEGEGGIYGATYDVPGLQGRHSFTGRLLKLAAPAAAQIDYTTHPDKCMLMNVEANLRGVLMKRIA